MTDISTPINVTPLHKRVTMLQSALAALEYNDNAVHLSPAQARNLLSYIKWFERVQVRDAVTISNLAERLAEFEDAEPPQWEGCP